jgi:F420H(2)-dependent quinone reductase
MPKPPSPRSPLWKAFYRFTDVHKAVHRLTKGRVGGSVPGIGKRIGIVHHVGAKSGKKRSLPLQYIVDEGTDAIAIIASKGGNQTHPGWFHNLKANPDTVIELVGGERRKVHARVATGEERARWWAAGVAVYPRYEEYQSYTDREIPVIVLEPRGA